MQSHKPPRYPVMRLRRVIPPAVHAPSKCHAAHRRRQRYRRQPPYDMKRAMPRKKIPKALVALPPPYRQRPQRRRQDCQQCQRHGHHRRRFVSMLSRRAALRPPECQPRHPCHIQRAQSRPRQRQRQEQPAPMLPHRYQYLVFAEKPAQRRYPRQRRRAYCECQRRQRHLAPQPAHAPHIRLIPKPVHHAARPQKQQRLGYPVRYQMQHRRRKPARAQRQHHQPQMAHRGIRQRPLYVRHHKRQRPRVQKCYQPYYRHREHCPRRKLKQRQHPRHQIHPRRDHRGGVYQRANRRRPLHRVRQPHMKRELRRLAHSAHKQQQRRRRQRPLPYRPRLRRRDNIRYLKRPRRPIQQYNPYQQPHIPYARRDKRLLSRLRRRPPLPPEPYQQIRPQSHQLPRDIQKQQIIRQNERQHSRPEQRLRREIPPEPRIPPHILQRINLHQQRHERNQPQHHDRQPIDMNAPAYRRIAYRQPLYAVCVIISAAPHQIRQRHCPQRQPRRHSRD